VQQGLLDARTAYGACPPTAGWAPMVTAALAILCLWADGPTEEILRLADEVISDPGATHHPIALTGAWALKAAVLAARADRRPRSKPGSRQLRYAPRDRLIVSRKERTRGHPRQAHTFCSETSTLPPKTAPQASGSSAISHPTETPPGQPSQR
jgi:hypothetical protein